MFVRVSSVLKCALALAAVSPCAVLAQADPALVTALAECRALGNDRMRLACFDDVVVRIGGVTEPVSRDADVPPPVAPERAAPAADNDSDARARRSQQPEPAATAAAPESVQVRIVEVGTDGIGRTRFVTDTGIVYRQTDSRSRRFPEAPFDAELRAGALGSSFLVVSGGRAVRVTQRD